MTSRFVAPIWEGDSDEFVVPPVERNTDEVEIIRANATVYCEQTDDNKQVVIVVVPHPTAFERIWSVLSAIYDKCTAEELVGLVWRIATLVVTVLLGLIICCFRFAVMAVCTLARACVYLLVSILSGAWHACVYAACTIWSTCVYVTCTIWHACVCVTCTIWGYTRAGILWVLLWVLRVLTRVLELCARVETRVRSACRRIHGTVCRVVAFTRVRVIWRCALDSLLFIRDHLFITRFLNVAVLLAIFLIPGILSHRADDATDPVPVNAWTDNNNTCAPVPITAPSPWNPFMIAQLARVWKPLPAWPPVRHFYTFGVSGPFDGNQTEPFPHEFVPSSMPPPQVRVITSVGTTTASPDVSTKDEPLELTSRCTFARRICAGTASNWQDTTVTSAAMRGLRIENSDFLRLADIPQACDLTYPIFECEQPNPEVVPVSEPGIPWETLRVVPRIRIAPL